MSALPALRADRLAAAGDNGHSDHNGHSDQSDHNGQSEVVPARPLVDVAGVSDAALAQLGAEVIRRALAGGMPLLGGAPTTLEAARAACLDTLAGKSPETARTYATGLRRLWVFLEERGIRPDHPTTALPPDLLAEFYLYLVRRYGRDRRATVAMYLASARAFVRFLGRRNLLALGLTREVMEGYLGEVLGRFNYKTPRIDKRLPEVVQCAYRLPLPRGTGPQPARERLELLRDRALLHTLYSTGMRRAEVASLNRGDIEDGHARQALITGKGEKERLVFFDDDALAAIRVYLAARADSFVPLFIRHDRKRGPLTGDGERGRLSPFGVWRVVKRYATLAGVEASPHAFRHDKASTLLNAGARLEEVQDLLGHASPETTKKIYAHYDTSHLRAVFDKYSVPLSQRQNWPP